MFRNSLLKYMFKNPSNSVNTDINLFFIISQHWENKAQNVYANPTPKSLMIRRYGHGYVYKTHEWAVTNFYRIIKLLIYCELR